MSYPGVGPYGGPSRPPSGPPAPIGYPGAALYDSPAPYASPASYAAPSAGRGPATPGERPGRGKRTGMEIAYLVLLIIALANCLLTPVGTMLSISLDLDGHFLLTAYLGVALSAYLWLIIAAIVQAVRRRPSAVPVAVGVTILFDIANLVNYPPLLDSWPVYPAVYYGGHIAILVLALRINHRYDARPVAVSLAQGLCLFAIARVPFIISHIINAFNSSSSSGIWVRGGIGPWGRIDFLVVLSNQTVATLLEILLAVAGGVGISSLWGRRNRGAWTRLAIGSCASTALLIGLGVFPRIVNPHFTGGHVTSGSETNPPAVYDLFIGVPVVLTFGLLVLLPAARAWFSAVPGQAGDAGLWAPTAPTAQAGTYPPAVYGPR